MPDRDKLIKAMKCCAEMDCGHECPYVPIGGCRAKVLQDAIALLEEQEPVVGDRDELLKALREAHKACLNAMQMLAEQEPVEPFHECSDGLYPRTLVTNRHFVFCPYCGRRIKWNAAD